MSSKTLQISIRGNAEEVMRAKLVLAWRLGSEFFIHNSEITASGLLRASFVVSDAEYESVCREIAEEDLVKGKDAGNPIIPARRSWSD